MYQSDKNAYFFISFIVCAAIAFCFFQVVNEFESIQKAKIAFLLLIIFFLSIYFGYIVFKLINQKIFIFKTIFERSKDAITIIDSNGYYKWQNCANIEFCGHQDKWLKKQKATLLINNTAIDVKTELDAVDAFTGMFKTICKQGVQESFVTAYKITDDFGGTICYVEMKRSSKQYSQILENTKREKERIEQIVNHDNLTRVLNRSGFYEAMQNRFFGIKPHGSIIFADIDNFKKLNDTYGHDFGDKVLKCTAELYKNNIRQSDIVARFGGEEFVIWLDANIDIAYEICEKIRLSLENSNIDGVFITSSFGISILIDNIENAIKNADKAMYSAKTSGKNKTVIFEEINLI